MPNDTPNARLHPLFAGILADFTRTPRMVALAEGPRCDACGRTLKADSPACPARTFHDGAPESAPCETVPTTSEGDA